MYLIIINFLPLISFHLFSVPSHPSFPPLFFPFLFALFYRFFIFFYFYPILPVYLSSLLVDLFPLLFSWRCYQFLYYLHLHAPPGLLLGTHLCPPYMILFGGYYIINNTTMITTTTTNSRSNVLSTWSLKSSRTDASIRTHLLMKHPLSNTSPVNISHTQIYIYNIYVYIVITHEPPLFCERSGGGDHLVTSPPDCFWTLGGSVSSCPTAYVQLMV